MTGIHFHVCEACRHVWHHKKLKDVALEERATAHRCPKCSAGPYRFAYETMHDAMEVKRLLSSDGPKFERATA